MEPADYSTTDLTREHLAALDVLRYAKNAFFSLALAAILLHIVAWIVVAHTDTLGPLLPSALSADSAAVAPTEAQITSARRWELALQSSLTLGGFVGRASALVLCGVYVLTLLISLAARLGGAGHLARACVWSLAAVAVLVPWLHAPQEALTAYSAFYGLEELSRSAAESGGFLAVVRFLLCPLLVAVFLVAAQIRFRHGYVQITAAPGARLSIHEV